MSEGRSDEHQQEAGTIHVEPDPPSTADPANPAGGPRNGSRAALLLLAALLVVIVAGVALSRFWAPALVPILPWAENPGASPDEYTALAARVAAIEKRPGPPTGEIDAIKSAVGMLSHRVDQLEAAGKGDRQTEEAVAADRAKPQQLEQRLGTIEAQSATQTSSATADRQNLKEEISRVGSTTADLSRRLSDLDRAVQSQGGADRTHALLALLLLQMRKAVEQARPFPVEYDAFGTLARNSDLAPAAEPLAEAARNGVASRAVLAKRLSELAGQVAPPAADADWGDQALARLRGLVTIRRIGGTGQTGPEAAERAGQAALARDDLAGAVAAIEPLATANGEAIRPWLRMARERLAAETALDHLQELLTDRLDSTPAAPSTAPPREPAEKARSPS
jgi:hypothetical protein